jgi:hypothetical protein
VVVRLLSPEVIETLNKYDLGEPIHFVGLGAHDFQFAYGESVVRSEYKASFKIAGRDYEWIEGPIDAPVWKLVGQKVMAVTAESDVALRFTLEQGDEIEVRTDEGPYEAIIIEAANRGILEVF